MINNAKRVGALAGIGALSLLPQSVVARESEERMNVLFLLVDDLRSNTVGCFGNDITITPNIDQLAEEGVKFPNACVTTSISAVSRATILTGQYMSSHNIRKFNSPISEEDWKRSFPGVVRESGYYTGLIGKYGVGKIREDQFDYSLVYEARHWLPTEDGGQIHITEKNRLDALDFLKNRPKDKNFSLYLGFYATHAEDNNPEQYLYQPSSEQYYSDVTVPMSPLDTDEAFNALPEFIQDNRNEGRVRWYWRFDTPERYQKYIKGYFRMLTEVDLAIKDIIDELKAQGVYDNTLIIFMGDNGYFLSDRRLADKWYPYEEGLSVPMIIRDPRMAENKRGMSNDEFVLNVDIAPTIISAIGAEVPDCMQGEDIAQLYLNEGNVEWRQEFFYEHPTLINKERIPASEALVRHNEKYVYWPDYGYEQYFDLKKDPSELHNGIDDKKYQNKISEMKATMSIHKANLSRNRLDKAND